MCSDLCLKEGSCPHSNYSSSSGSSCWELALRYGLVLAFLTIGLGVAARAETPEIICAAPFADILSDKVFERFPANRPSGPSTPIRPDVRSGKAHLYRTVIREEAKQGVNFAGHFTIIRIGCGAATVCPAIYGTRSGTVFFPGKLKSATSLQIDSPGPDIDTLNYRRDSQLLIVVGSLNENSARAGVSYYLWRSEKLSEIKFTPAVKLCSIPKDDHL